MLSENNMAVREEILDLSRQRQIGEWHSIHPFSRWLDDLIESGDFLAPHDLEFLNAAIIRDTARYRVETGVSTVVLGMSGGIDSALTAAIFKKAGYRVIGVTMPINQDQAETDRGVEACAVLGIEHRHFDLSPLYNQAINAFSGLFSGGDGIDDALGEILDDADPASKAIRVRRGNIRARLRMITLYNLASLEGGFVASTDNLSELGAGFWTLHGDVGDFAPIQSLLKSWEVPYLARLNGVPESTVRATPTDGLAVLAGGDEAQLGCSYLEWDILTFKIAEALDRIDPDLDIDEHVLAHEMGVDALVYPQFQSVLRRMGSTWFKRKNPLNVRHPLADRYALLEKIDDALFVPKSVSAAKAPAR
jgi:NAD+ synthetase